MTQGATPADQELQANLSDEEIAARLEAQPELLKRFQRGDATVIADILAAVTGAEVTKTTVRQLA